MTPTFSPPPSRSRVLLKISFLLTLGSLLFAGLPPTCLRAQTAISGEALPGLSLEAGTLFLGGSAKELVYKTSGSDELLSRLVYPIPPSLGVFTEARARLAEVFEAGIRFETVWPLTRGNLTDDDWVGISASLDPNIHSDSEGYLSSYLNLRFELGFPLRVESFTFRPLLGLVHRNVAWEGWNAVQVDSRPTTPVTEELYGQVIDYSQTWWIPYLGFGASYENANFSLRANLRFSPYSFVNDQDIHILTKTTYSDFMQGGIVFFPELGFGLKLNSRIALTLGLSMEIARGQRGYIVQSSNGGSTSGDTYSRSNDVAGATYEEFAIQLGLDFVF